MLIRYINKEDIDSLNLSNLEILETIEKSLFSQGTGKTVIEPRVHLIPNNNIEGHFNVLRGYISDIGDNGIAGIKVVGDFVDNYKINLPSELALITLYSPITGEPIAIIDGTEITSMRTGALTAIGAKYLAKKDSKILGHLGARGTAWWNVVLLDEIFNFEKIYVSSRREESRNNFGKKLSKVLNKEIIVTDNPKDCLMNADIKVEATRLITPTPLLKTSWIKDGDFVVPYGTISAVENNLTDVMDKIVVDDWKQCSGGQFGSLRFHVDNKKLTKDTLYAELCEIVAGNKAARQSDDEKILFWHRGLSLNDISLANLILEKCLEQNIGTDLKFR